MSIIYEPRGKAKEYSDLACNLYSGCSHACKYCYCPSIRRMSLDKWARDPKPRENILKKLAKEAAKMRGEKRHLLFCFMSDPYQDDHAASITKQALLICENYEFKNIQILTKAGQRAINDFDILLRNKWKFGSTIIFKNEKMREEWEPGAPSIDSRIDAIKEAHKKGIFTWVSIEPVVDPEEAYKVMYALKGYITKWKVGKLNHFSEIEKNIDWKDFYHQSLDILKGEDVYWKKDLLRFA
jgi:DNA repair photolyase